MDIKALIKALEERGIPVTIVKVKLTPKQQRRQKQIKKDVREYVMKIEEAHKRAANSKLHFGTAVC